MPQDKREVSILVLPKSYASKITRHLGLKRIMQVGEKPTSIYPLDFRRDETLATAIEEVENGNSEMVRLSNINPSIEPEPEHDWEMVSRTRYKRKPK